MKKLLYVPIVAVAGANIVLASPVSASNNTNTSTTTREVKCESPSVSIPHPTVVRGDVGSKHVLKTVQVNNGSYKVTITSTNQRSEHPGSDIIVRSGSSEVIVKDVERRAFIEETSTGTILIENNKATISVQLGEDKVFSGGVCVTFKKVVPEQPTPATPATPARPQPKVETPAPEMPKTGAANLLAIGSFSTIFGYAAHRVSSYKRRG